MKIGYRKPSISKKFKAKTTGRIKRATKSSINPLYGKKGMGYVNNPKKAIYNKVYNKTTKSVYDTSYEDLDTNFDYIDYIDNNDSIDNLIDESIYVDDNLINNKNKKNPLLKILLTLLIILNIILWTLVILITHFGLW